MASRGNRRSRTVLLWGLCLFLAAQLLGSLLLDYCWPLLRFPSFSRVLTTLAAMPPPRIVFLGSSRIEVGIDQGEVGTVVQKRCSGTRQSSEPYPTLNAAVPAGDPITAEYLLGQLLEKGVQPDWVVLEVSPETLNRSNEWLAIHVRRQLRWEHVPGYVVEVCWSGQGMRFLHARLFGPFLHREQILRAVSTNVFGRSETSRPPENAANLTDEVPAPPPLDCAKEPIDWDRVLQPPEREVTPKLRDLIQLTTDRQVSLWLQHYRIAGNSSWALERTLQLCQKHRIRVLLLAVPVTSPHRQTYTPAIEQTFQEYLAGLLQKYPCHFIDCRDWMQDGLFLDNHHLNTEGRVYFSRMLAYHVLAPLVQDQPITTPKTRANCAQGR